VNLVSQILTVFKADTSEMKRAIKELQGAEKERAEQQLKNAEQENSGYDKALRKLADVNQVLELAGKAAKFAGDAMKQYADHTRLTAATAGVNMDKLSEAFGGLVNQHELLTFAAKTQSGVLALNQQEMELVGRAALALRSRGHDLEDSMRKLTDAMVKGTVGGLDDLGLKIKEGDSRAQTLKNTMDELKRVADESGASYEQAGDRIRKLATDWDNATDAIKRYVAETVNLAAEHWTGARDADADEMLDIFEAKHGRGMGWVQALAEAEQEAQGRANVRYENKINPPPRQDALGKRKEEMAVIEMADDYVGGGKSKRVKDASKAYADRLARDILDGARESLERNLNDVVHGPLYAANPSSGLLGGKAGGNRDEFGRDIDEGAMARQASMDRIYEHEKGLRDAADEKLRLSNLRESQNIGQLEKIFGPIEQFELYEQAFSHFGATFTAFSEAMGAGYEAIVTGQGGVGAAIKKTLADGLMAIGKSSVVEALRQTALGFGALAFGSPTAGMHFKSAAMHGAVAVAAGLAANQIGTSAQAAASDKAAAEKAKDEKAGGGRSGGSVSSGSGEGGKSERPIYVIVGDQFSQDSPRMRSIRANEAVERALRERDE
jgi:hypothetical protein